MCTTLAPWAFVLACADLRAPPPAGQAGAASPPAGGNGGSTTPGGSSAGSAITSGASGGASSPTGGSGGSGGSAAVPAGSGGDSGGTGSEPSAGETGASGSAGENAGGSCQHSTSGELRAWLFRELTSAGSSELHPFFALTTTGADVPLQELSIRYYFSAEMSGQWQVDCIWVTEQNGSGSGLCDKGVSMSVVALDPPRPQADHYLEVSFAGVSGHALSNVTMPSVEARSMFWRDGHPTLNQTNDYSFVPTTDTVMTLEGREYAQTSKVTVYQNGALVWGEEPCP